MRNQIKENFNLYICGKHEREKFFDKKITHILYLEDPEEKKSHPFQFYGYSKQICFYDSEEESKNGSPTEYNVLTIINFIKFCLNMSKHGQVNLLISCLAGVSRSTAAGLIAIAIANEGRNYNLELSWEKLTLVRDGAWPNLLILKYADKILNYQEKFLEYTEIQKQAIAQAKSVWLPN